MLLLPEELPQFPSRQELVLELTEALARFNVHTQHLDRWVQMQVRVGDVFSQWLFRFVQQMSQFI